MSLNFINVGRIALGLVAEIACCIKPLDKKYQVSRRLRGPWPKGPFLWLHGASMGECKMLLNLASALQDDIPNLPKILITSQKPEVVRFLRESLAQGTAAEPACGKPEVLRPACGKPEVLRPACGKPEVLRPACGKPDVLRPACGKPEVALAPADVPWTLEKFLRRTKPVGLILGENELWAGYLSAVQRYTKRPSVALVSGRFQKAIPGMDFSGLGFASMQTSADQSRFLKFSAKSFRAPISVGGNWKLLNWSRRADCARSESAGDSSQVKTDGFVSFISLHIEELPALQKILDSLVRQEKNIVLAPRRLEEIPRFASAFKARNFPVVQWPAIAPGAISIVHTFGKVREILSRSESAYIGGSFHKSLGVHDFWEPLQLNVPTFVGPFCRGAESAVQDLAEQGALVRLKTSSLLVEKLADRARIASALSQEREKILNSYALLKKFVEELLL